MKHVRHGFRHLGLFYHLVGRHAAAVEGARREQPRDENGCMSEQAEMAKKGSGERTPMVVCVPRPSGLGTTSSGNGVPLADGRRRKNPSNESIISPGASTRPAH